MRTIINNPIVAALIGLVVGLALGCPVATAMGYELHLYMRFIGVLVLVAVGVVGVWVYRTYIRPEDPVVEEQS